MSLSNLYNTLLAEPFGFKPIPPVNSDYTPEELNRTLEEHIDPDTIPDLEHKKYVKLEDYPETRTQAEIDEAGHEQSYLDRKNI